MCFHYRLKQRSNGMRVKGIKNRGAQVHGVHKCKPKYRDEYLDDFMDEIDRVQLLEQRDHDEWDDYIRRYGHEVCR